MITQELIYMMRRRKSVSIEFYNTGIGRKFYDHTVPRIAKALERIAKALERLNDRSNIQNGADTERDKDVVQ